MDLFILTVRRISQVCGIASAAALAGAVLIVCQMVVMRYLLNASTVWQTEFVIYSLVAATFIGCPYVLLQRGHVNVDLLPLYLQHRQRVFLSFIVSVAALAFCLLLTYTGWELFLDAYLNNWRTDTVWELPLWIPYLTLPVGMALLSLQYVADILCVVTGRDMPFGLKPEDRP